MTTPTQWNLADLFEAVADAVPDRTAIVVGDRRLTFREVDERATRLAHHLAAQGVKPGDHVGLYLYNGPEYVEGLFAAYKLRAVPINVNYRYVEAELAYLFDNADLVGLVHGREFVPRIAAVKDECPKLVAFVAVEDGSGEDLSTIGAVEYEAALAPRHRSATSRPARRRTSTSSTPAARPGCRRASCGRRRTSSSRRSARCSR